MNGWVATDDWEKAHRWAETIEWAKRWQLDDLLPEIPEGRRYYTTDEQAQRSRKGLWDEIKEFKQRYPDDDAAMPTVLRWRGYRFHLYSREPDEPPHVHVTKAGAQAKVWLSDGTVARSLGYPDRELNELCRKVREHRDELLKAWHDYFGQA